MVATPCRKYKPFSTTVTSCFPLYLIAFSLFNAKAQSQGPDTVYADRRARFVVMHATKEVEGLDIELWGALAQGRKTVQSPPDTITLQFFVADKRQFVITLRDRSRAFEIKPVAVPVIGFHCWKIPRAKLQAMEGPLNAVGKIFALPNDGLVLVGWNAMPPDSLSRCEFILRPNKKIKERYEILREMRPNEWEVFVRMGAQRFHPGQAPFKIVWDGHANGRSAPEGRYKLRLEATIFESMGIKKEEFPFEFYFKPDFKSCEQQTK